MQSSSISWPSHLVFQQVLLVLSSKIYPLVPFYHPNLSIRSQAIITSYMHHHHHHFFFLAWLSGSHLTHCHFHLVHTQPAARVSLLKWKSNHVMVLTVLMSFHLIWNPYIESDMTFFLSYHRLSVSNSASAMLVPWCCLYMTSRFVPRFS